MEKEHTSSDGAPIPKSEKYVTYQKTRHWMHYNRQQFCYLYRQLGVLLAILLQQLWQNGTDVFTGFLLLMRFLFLVPLHTCSSTGTVVLDLHTCSSTGTFMRALVFGCVNWRDWFCVRWLLSQQQLGWLFILSLKHRQWTNVSACVKTEMCEN